MLTRDEFMTAVYGYKYSMWKENEETQARKIVDKFADKLRALIPCIRNADYEKELGYVFGYSGEATIYFWTHTEERSNYGVGISAASLWVYPEHRRKGLGRKLMEATCEAADEVSGKLFLKPQPFTLNWQRQSVLLDEIPPELEMPDEIELINWYETFGFIHLTKGDIYSRQRMIRFPNDNQEQ